MFTDFVRNNMPDFLPYLSIIRKVKVLLAMEDELQQIGMEYFQDRDWKLNGTEVGSSSGSQHTKNPAGERLAIKIDQLR